MRLPLLESAAVRPLCTRVLSPSAASRVRVLTRDCGRQGRRSAASSVRFGTREAVEKTCCLMVLRAAGSTLSGEFREIRNSRSCRKDMLFDGPSGGRVDAQRAPHGLLRPRLQARPQDTLARSSRSSTGKPGRDTLGSVADKGGSAILLWPICGSRELLGKCRDALSTAGSC